MMARFGQMGPSTSLRMSGAGVCFDVEMARPARTPLILSEVEGRMTSRQLQ